MNIQLKICENYEGDYNNIVNGIYFKIKEILANQNKIEILTIKNDKKFIEITDKIKNLIKSKKKIETVNNEIKNIEKDLCLLKKWD